MRFHRHVSTYAIGVIASCTFLGGCALKSGAGGQLPARFFTVSVNKTLKPRSAPPPPFADGAARPLATLRDKAGRQADFIENELMVEFATDQALKAFLAKWNGVVLATDRPATVGVNANPLYLIRVQPERANVAGLTDALSRLNPNGASPVAVNSQAARRLIAAAAETAVNGVPVGINYITRSTGFQDEKLTEAPTSNNAMFNDAGALIENWDPNPWNWVYMKRGGPLDIGVPAAWKVLDRVGALNNKVKIAVIDGGFGGGDDFPLPYEFNKHRSPRSTPPDRTR